MMAPTVILHRDQPYLAEHQAKVIAVPEPGTVVLDQTAFYVRSGGQAADHGMINDETVTALSIEGEGMVVHHLEQPFTGAVGDNVSVVIDWHRRYRLMRSHGAQHLTFVVLRDLYGLATDLGGDISPDRGRVDVAHRSDHDPVVDAHAVEEAVNDLVMQDHQVHRSQDRDGRWKWAIDGIAEMPCGGTHVKSTREIGVVRISAKRKGSKVLRVSAAIGYDDK